MYYRPEYLKTLHVLSLRTKLILLLRNTPPSKSFFSRILGRLFPAIALGIWFNKHLSQDEFQTLNLIGTAVGEQQANLWLSEVLEEAGLKEKHPDPYPV